jgi:thiol-disulfide isomerase/thioredoxin
MLLKNYLFILVLGASSLVQAQKNDKKTDTSSVNLSSVNLKVDSLLKLMNSKVITYIDAQNTAQNKVHEEEVAQLRVAISELKASEELKQKQINLNKEEKKNSDSEIAKLRDQVKSNSDVLLKQKEQLRMEIGALQKQSFKINETILNSLGERLNITPGIEASWIQTYQDFKVKRNLLSKADELLSKPYDAQVNQLIGEINSAFSSSQQFAELTKEKAEFIDLLSGYCEKSEEMKSLLNSVSKLNDFKEERDKKINNTMYYYVGYDYLISIIQKNKVDFNHNPIKNTITDCE